MKKLLKILAWTVGGLLALLALALLTLTLVFDPNDYKGEIIAAVKSATGRELKIDGKLSWTLFPWLGVKAEGLALGNAPGFGPKPFDPPFAKVGSAGVSVELLPLLRGRVNVDTLHVRDLALHLAKDGRGRNNWADLTETKKSTPTPASKQEPEARAATAVAVGGVDIQRATLTYRDAAQGSAYALRDLELKTGRIGIGSPIDTRLRGTLEYGKPAQHVRLALDTALTLSDNALALRALKLGLDDSTLTGAIEVVDLEKAALRFELALDKIDLDRYLDTAPPEKTASAAKGAAPKTAAAPVAIPIESLRTLNARGKLRIGSLTAFGIRSSEVAIELNAHNGLVRTGPNSARLYGGAYAGRTTLDVRPAKPLLTMDEQLKNVQIGPLLKDADLFDRYSGTGDVALKLTGSGLDAQQLKQTLSGAAQFDLRDGKISGVNLQKIVSEGRRLYDAARGKSVTVAPAGADETAFKRLQASAKVVNGVARTDDLKLEGPVVRADGAGSADLARETLDYRLRVTVAEAADRKGTTVPVKIGGTFAQPTYGVEFEELLKKEVEKRLEQKLEQKLDRLRRKRN